MKKLLVLFCLAACATNPAVSTTSQGECISDGQGGNHCCPGSPIIIDMLGDGVHLTSASDGALFQLHPGQYGKWAWTQPNSDDAFLVLDVNANGRIDDGSEMFGDGSAQVPGDNPNGFAALAYYDMPEQGGNSDGVIDSKDSVWSRLRLWRDADRNAFSSPDELIALDAAGVHSFSLSYVGESVFDLYGNESKFVSTIIADDPIAKTVADIWLTQAEIGLSPQSCTTSYYCAAWSYAVASDIDNTGINPPCSIANVVSGITSVIDGRTYRFVYRLDIGSNAADTAAAAEQNLFAKMKGPDGHCLFGPIPAHDPYGQVGSHVVNHGPLPPWDAFSYQAVCTTTTICTTPPPGQGCN